MSIVAKLKAHPYLSVLGLGAAALGVDYVVEGDRSVAASIWRGLFGGSGGDAGGGGGAVLRHQAVPAGMPAGPVAPPMEYVPGYYPAFPPEYHPHWGYHPRGLHQEVMRHHEFDRMFGRGYGHGEGRRHERRHGR